MDKKWLIRTRSNHILGPVSKEKVMELYKNGSIKSDDEICSGNGYWFFIRETELVEKYLTGSFSQSFNPISEAKDVITSSAPDENLDNGKDDITLVGGINLSDLKKETGEVSDSLSIKKNEVVDDMTELEVPEIPGKRKVVELPESTKKKTNLESKNKSSSPSSIKKTSQKSQNFLTYIGMIIFIVLFLAIYFRKTIMKSFFSQMRLEQVINSSLIEIAYAQDDLAAQKKNF